MKLLRVLTGSHAGARLALSDGLWRIAGPDEGADGVPALSVTLEDWRHGPLSLRVSNGAVELGVDGIGPQNWLTWPDLQARRFGDTVLCVGDEAAAWPADVSLLAPLVQPPVPPVQPMVPNPPARAWRSASAWRAWLVALACGGTLALVVASPTPPVATGAAANLRDPTSPADSRHALAIHNAARVRAALAAAEVLGLQVQSERGQVRVSGLLESVQADARARTALLPFRDEVTPQWQLAPQLLESLRSALHGQGVAVRYAGDGVYVVEGTTPRPDLVRGLAARLAQDLAPGVRAVQVDVQAPVTRPRLAAQLETGSTRYAVRPDGAKAFSPRD